MALVQQETWINLLSQVPRLAPDVFFRVVEETLVDGILKTKTELVGAHKFVLAMASDVFKARFNVLKATFSGQAPKGKIPITGVTIRSFKEFLKFIYGLFASSSIVNAISDECCGEILHLCKTYKIEKAASLMENRIGFMGELMKLAEEQVTFCANDVKVEKIGKRERKLSEEEERERKRVKVEDHSLLYQEYDNNIFQTEGCLSNVIGKKDVKFSESNIKEGGGGICEESKIKEKMDKKFEDSNIKEEQGVFEESNIKKEKLETESVRSDKKHKAILEYVEPEIEYEKKVFLKEESQGPTSCISQIKPLAKPMAVREETQDKGENKNKSEDGQKNYCHLCRRKFKSMHALNSHKKDSSNHKLDLREYTKCFIIRINVNKQIEEIRTAVSDRALVLGKNKIFKRDNILCNIGNNPCLSLLLPYSKGKLAFVFTKEDLSVIKDLLLSVDIWGPLKEGQVSPVDVVIPAYNTAIPLTRISIFQELSIPTKIISGNIEITDQVHLIKSGDTVGYFQATLLNLLKILPVLSRPKIEKVYENGIIFDPVVLDLRQEPKIKDIKDNNLK